jgi:hypothetical protein
MLKALYEAIQINISNKISVLRGCVDLRKLDHFKQPVEAISATCREGIKAQ